MGSSSPCHLTLQSWADVPPCRLMLPSLATLSPPGLAPLSCTAVVCVAISYGCPPIPSLFVLSLVTISHASIVLHCLLLQYPCAVSCCSLLVTSLSAISVCCISPQSLWSHLLLPTAAVATTPLVPLVGSIHHLNPPCLSVHVLINLGVPCCSGKCSIGVCICLEFNCKSFRMSNRKSHWRPMEGLTSSPTKKVTL